MTIDHLDPPKVSNLSHHVTDLKTLHMSTTEKRKTDVYENSKQYSSKEYILDAMSTVEKINEFSYGKK